MPTLHQNTAQTATSTPKFVPSGFFTDDVLPLKSGSFCPFCKSVGVIYQDRDCCSQCGYMPSQNTAQVATNAPKLRRATNVPANKTTEADRVHTLAGDAPFSPCLACAGEVDADGLTCRRAAHCDKCREFNGGDVIGVLAKSPAPAPAPAPRPSKVEELAMEAKSMTVRQILGRRKMIENSAAICADAIANPDAGLASWAIPNWKATRERVLSHYNALIFVLHTELVARGKADSSAEPPAKRFKVAEGTPFYGDPFCDLDCNENICCEACYEQAASFNKPLPVPSRPTPKQVFPERESAAEHYAHLLAVRDEAMRCPEFNHAMPTEEEMESALIEAQYEQYCEERDSEPVCGNPFCEGVCTCAEVEARMGHESTYPVTDEEAEQDEMYRTEQNAAWGEEY